MFVDWSLADWVYWLMVVAAAINLVVLAHNLWTTHRLRRTTKQVYEQIDNLTATRKKLDDKTTELSTETEKMKAFTARMENELETLRTPRRG